MKKIANIIIFIFILNFNIKGQVSTVQLLIKEGIELHDSTEYQKAIEKFEAALKINPNSTLALYELSLSYLELKDYDNALKYSTMVINENDKNLLTGAYAVKSEALAGIGQIDNAIALLQEGLIKIGESYLLHFNIALNYYKKNDIDKTLEHVSRAIELDKTFSGAFLLSAYALRDKGMWIRSIYSFQMFLLLEPDSKRSANAFEEMLQIMNIKPTSEKPVERSFIQMQMMKNKRIDDFVSHSNLTSNPDSTLNREYVFNEIKLTLDSLKTENNNEEVDTFTAFKEVNKTILNSLAIAGGHEITTDTFWTFHYPFFMSILNSNYYEAFCRYISVSFIPESLQWWENNNTEAENFINWFEKGDDKGNK